MKKLNLIIAILLLSIVSFAQQTTGNISTATIEYGTWYVDATDPNEGEWIMDGDAVPYVSLFEITETTIKHTTDDHKSTYFIKNSSVNTAQERVEFVVTSDTGTKYTIIVDTRNKNIRALYYDGKDDLRITRLVFKNTWVEN